MSEEAINDSDRSMVAGFKPATTASSTNSTGLVNDTAYHLPANSGFSPDGIDAITGNSIQAERDRLAEQLQMAIKENGSGPGGLLPSRNGAVRAEDNQIAQMLNSDPTLAQLQQAAQTLQTDEASATNNPTQSRNSSGISSGNGNSLAGLLSPSLMKMMTETIAQADVHPTSSNVMKPAPSQGTALVRV